MTHRVFAVRKGSPSMRGKYFYCALIILLAGWLLPCNSFDARALSPTDANQTQPGVNAADRDAAIADITKDLAGHEDEPAEKVFKNIEILKGKKASRLP